MATKAETRLPYGVGRLGAGFYVLALALVVGIGLGVFAYARQLSDGISVTGLRDIGPMGGAPWGLYVAFVAHFIGVSVVGMTLAGLIHLFNLEHLKPISRLAIALTIMSLVLGAFSVLADLGQPLRGLINLFMYARPGSPFFGTFSVVIFGYFWASLVYLYLDGRRDAAILAKVPSKLQGFYRLWAAGYKDTQAERERNRRTTFWLVLAAIPVLVAALSTEGFIFGLQGGAAGWYGALQGPSFVVMAAVSGIGHIIVLAFFARSVLGLQDKITLRQFSWLGNLLWILVAVYLYLMIVEMITGIYQAHDVEGRVTRSLLIGRYAWLYWLTVGLLVSTFLLLFAQFIKRRYFLLPTALAGLLAGTAGVVKRYLIVVPSQTDGRLLPYLPGSYSPTWVEWLVVAGLMAMGALGLLVFFKIFPIMQVAEEKEGGK